MERRDDENREMMIQAISSLVYEQWERLNRDPYLVPVGISGIYSYTHEVFESGWSVCMFGTSSCPGAEGQLRESKNTGT